MQDLTHLLALNGDIPTITNVPILMMNLTSMMPAKMQQGIQDGLRTD
ncbi:hypothetical protein PEC106568_07510 [Pectobacterium carotovorum subsp. carotovorum]|nr:hypothetical protein PEC106568_07510 [Pectobacterium carotovorum subsp. carotovorum]